MNIKINFKVALLASVAALVSVSLIVSNYMCYENLKEISINGTKTHLRDKVEKESENLENFIASKLIAVGGVSDFYKTHSSTGAENDVRRLEIASRSMDLGFVMVGYNDGRAYAGGSTVTWKDGIAPSDFVPSSRPWFSQAKSTRDAFLSEIYRDSATNQYIVSAGKDFGDGVILADIPLGILDSSTQGIASDISFGVIITDDGVVLSTTSEGVKISENIKNYPSLSNLYQFATKHHEGFIDYEMNGIKKLAFTHEINVGNSKKWYAITGVTHEDLFADVDIMARNAVITTLVMILVSVFIMILVLRVVYKPVISLRDVLAKMSQGEADLTQRLTVANKDDDLGKITIHINEWISDNQNTMLQIKSVSDELGRVVNNVRDNSSNNLAILSEHVGQTEQVVTAIEEMNVTARSVAESASQAAEVTQSANTTGEESRLIVEEAQQSVIALVGEVENAVSGVQTMSNESENITSITDVIGGIAEQTNLLALNAAIEAARAGEYGRGFAVVADEVRSLASRTQTSTSEIDTAVGSLTSSSTAIVSAMDETKRSCEKTAEQTSIVGDSLGALSDAISEINGITEQIATAAEEQTSVSEEISKNMTETSHMANTVNENIQETASNVETMASMYEQLNSIVGNSKI